MTTSAPYFSLTRALWIPRVVTWDAKTGFFERVDGPEGFRDYRTALEASRFLVGTVCLRRFPSRF